MGILPVLMCLDLLLLGGSKLRAHISSQPGLLSKAIPFCLLFTEELGFVPTARRCEHASCCRDVEEFHAMFEDLSARTKLDEEEIARL